MEIFLIVNEVRMHMLFLLEGWSWLFDFTIIMNTSTWNWLDQWYCPPQWPGGPQWFTVERSCLLTIKKIEKISTRQNNFTHCITRSWHNGFFIHHIDATLISARNWEGAVTIPIPGKWEAISSPSALHKLRELNYKTHPEEDLYKRSSFLISGFWRISDQQISDKNN